MLTLAKSLTQQMRVQEESHRDVTPFSLLQEPPTLTGGRRFQQELAIWDLGLSHGFY